MLTVGGSFVAFIAAAGPGRHVTVARCPAWTAVLAALDRLTGGVFVVFGIGVALDSRPA
jgi:hypothetical protein